MDNMRRIDDESVNGVPYEAIEDYREIQEPYWTCVSAFDVKYSLSCDQSIENNKLLTKKLYKLCVD
tara:strand:+ start:10272 stop:10469 length:198 start_codon:yes stop_codon:yes gene_type:complete